MKDEPVKENRAFGLDTKGGIVFHALSSDRNHCSRVRSARTTCVAGSANSTLGA